MRYFIFFIFTLACFDGFSQNVFDTRVRYNSNRNIERSGLVSLDLNRIVIDKKGEIIWQDGHGYAKATYIINSVSGTLALNNSGQITYHISSQSSGGQLTLRKINATIKISLILIEEGKPRSIEFEIASYNVI